MVIHYVERETYVLGAEKCSSKTTALSLRNRARIAGKKNAPVIAFALVRIEKTYRNLIDSNRYQIVFTILRLIWIQTDCVRMDPNQTENDKYNLISD